MSIQCPSCQQELSTDGVMPRFCSACGSPLVDPADDPNQSVGAEVHDPTPGVNFEPTIALSNLASEQARRSARRHDGQETLGFSGGTSTAGGAESGVLPPGSFVGPFRIVGMLGQGGMGTVYEAVHAENAQVVALKLLSRSVRTTEETIQRFQRESQIAASINHPRSTFVYQAGQHEGQFYITMELMTGGTLTDVVREGGPVPVAQAVDHILDIISGLQSAHEAGIVHRDLKPSNCFLDQRGRVKIGDYGLAKSFLNDSSLTQTGAFMGTPQYAAPEQLRASEVDERADIYAIGGTLFYLLTGRAPFIGNAAQVIASITSEKPPRVDSMVSSVPRELSRIVNQTLEKEPARRPENLEALRQALLPYSTRGISSADIGRRMAAFFLDIAVLFFIFMLASWLMGLVSQVFAPVDLHQVMLLNIFVAIFVSVGYFSLQEWQFGTTLGKWMLGMRVITEANQSPGLMASLVRASLLPGVSYFASSLPAYFLNLDHLAQGDHFNIWPFVWLQVSQLVSWIPCLLCFVTGRKSNGMRGLHEILSRTRVVRLAGALEYKRPQNVPVTFPVALESPESYGQFTALGELGQRPDEGSSVLLGRDDSLDRDVWIVKRAGLQPSEFWNQRKTLARPARLRILEEQVEDDHRWVVTEAVRGMPLVDYLVQTPRVDWGSFRPLLRELAYELAISQEDGTLPARMELQSVWIDRDGRIKLLDQAIKPFANPASAAVESEQIQLSESSLLPTGSSGSSLNTMVASSTGPWLDSFDLLSGMLDSFIHHQVVPAHVLTFRKEMEIVRTEPDSLRTLGQRLGELADQPSAWRWDDRLGVLAISAGVEYAAASSIGPTMGLIVAYCWDFSMPMVGLLMFVIGSVLAIVMGAALGGGPVFHITGVLVRRNRTLEPASPLRCAVRNWITWLPFILAIACLAVFLEFVIKPDMMTVEQPRFEFSGLNDPWVIGALLLALPTMMIMTLAPIYAILRPSRGIPDVLAGTRLIRK